MTSRNVITGHIPRNIIKPNQPNSNTRPWPRMMMYNRPRISHRRRNALPLPFPTHAITGKRWVVYEKIVVAGEEGGRACCWPGPPTPNGIGIATSGGGTTSEIVI